MKFSEMPYRRVEVEEAAQRSEEIRKALAEASSYEEARAALYGAAEVGLQKLKPSMPWYMSAIL